MKVLSQFNSTTERESGRRMRRRFKRNVNMSERAEAMLRFIFWVATFAAVTALAIYLTEKLF